MHHNARSNSAVPPTCLSYEDGLEELKHGLVSPWLRKMNIARARVTTSYSWGSDTITGKYDALTQLVLWTTENRLYLPHHWPLCHTLLSNHISAQLSILHHPYHENTYSWVLCFILMSHIWLNKSAKLFSCLPDSCYKNISHDPYFGWGKYFTCLSLYCRTKNKENFCQKREEFSRCTEERWGHLSQETLEFPASMMKAHFTFCPWIQVHFHSVRFSSSFCSSESVSIVCHQKREASKSN